MKKLLIILLALFIAVPAVQAKKKRIWVVPAEAKIYVNGKYTADGSCVLRFNKKHEVYELKFECPGYSTREHICVMRSDSHHSIIYELNRENASDESTLSKQLKRVTPQQ